ncbi:MAG: ATP-dependent 6-phosphofructokinase [Candidatus Latescibacterota bacterium]
MEKIGILTGGGDAPGLNAVIRAVTVKAVREGYEVIGFKSGWKGMLEQDYRRLSLEDVEDIHRLGGTILGSSRTNVSKVENGFELVKQNLAELNIHALIAVGGDDTLGVAKKLHEAGGRVVGVPKTVDNDINATDYTFGFDTAINRVMDALDCLHTTTRSHNRVMVVEIMGRDAGWIALHGGMAGGAHVILIPEVPFDIDEVCAAVNKRYEDGKEYAIIAVAEGAKNAQLAEKMREYEVLDEFGHIQKSKQKVGIAQVLSEIIEERTQRETRHLVLGHLQRGGNPSAFDRVFSTRLGVKAVEMVMARQFGMMAAMHGGEIVPVPLDEALGEPNTVSTDRYEVARLFFG